jgi:predicted nucleotidyltransferase
VKDDAEKLAHDLQVIAEWAAGEDIVQRVWFYGSRFRGTHRSDSDIDIAVEHGKRPGDSNEFTTAISESSQWEDAINRKTYLKVDVQSYRTGDCPTVGAGLEAGCRIIYERG